MAAILLSSCVNPGGTPPFELSVGDCFDDRWFAADEGDRILRVEVLPCDQPHQNEVTALVPVDGEARPPRDQFVDLIESECPTALEEYAGAVPEGMEATGRFPSTNSWNLGYRWVICFVHSADGSLVEGSVAQSPAPVETATGR